MYLLFLPLILSRFVLVLLFAYEPYEYEPLYIFKSYDLENDTTGLWKTVTSGRISSKTNIGMLSFMEQGLK